MGFGQSKPIVVPPPISKSPVTISPPKPPPPMPVPPPVTIPPPVPVPQPMPVPSPMPVSSEPIASNQIATVAQISPLESLVNKLKNVVRNMLHNCKIDQASMKLEQYCASTPYTTAFRSTIMEFSVGLEPRTNAFAIANILLEIFSDQNLRNRYTGMANKWNSELENINTSDRQAVDTMVRDVVDTYFNIVKLISDNQQLVQLLNSSTYNENKITSIASVDVPSPQGISVDNIVQDIESVQPSSEISAILYPNQVRIKFPGSDLYLAGIPGTVVKSYTTDQLQKNKNLIDTWTIRTSRNRDGKFIIFLGTDTNTNILYPKPSASNRALEAGNWIYTSNARSEQSFRDTTFGNVTNIEWHKIPLWDVQKNSNNNNFTIKTAYGSQNFWDTRKKQWVNRNFPIKINPKNFIAHINLPECCGQNVYEWEIIPVTNSNVNTTGTSVDNLVESTTGISVDNKVEQFRQYGGYYNNNGNGKYGDAQHVSFVPIEGHFLNNTGYQSYANIHETELHDGKFWW